MQNDLSTLPSRLPSIHTRQGPITIERLQPHHAEKLADAGNEAMETVQPWLGKTLCPNTPRNAQLAIKQLEQARMHGYGITYLLQFDNECLGMGLINYIHPVHKLANLGYWLRPSARGQGLAQALCQSLIKLGFEQMELVRLELVIEEANSASVKLAKRLGAEREGLCKKRVFGRDALLYSITR